MSTLLARPFSIPSASLEPALLAADRVIATPLVSGPLPLRRGDVVVVADARGWLEDEAPAPAAVVVVVVLTWLRVLPDPAQGHLVKRVGWLLRHGEVLADVPEAPPAR